MTDPLGPPISTDPALSALQRPARRLGEEGLSCFWRHKIIAEILDLQEKENSTRPDFRPAIEREMIERAISQLLGIYDCRPSDTAAAYGWIGLWEVLGVDWRTLKFLPRDTAEQAPPQ